MMRSRLAAAWIGRWAMAAAVCCAVGQGAEERPVNLVSNPSFEAGTRFEPQGWEARFGAEWADVARTGARSLRITRPRLERPRQYWLSAPIRVKPGRPWLTVSGWLKTSDVGLLWGRSDHTYNAGLTAVFLDATGKEKSRQKLIGQHGNRLAGWAYKKARFQPPAWAAALRLVFEFRRPKTLGTAWLDDVVLSYATGPSDAPAGKGQPHSLQLTTKRVAMLFYPGDALEFHVRLKPTPPAGAELVYACRDYLGRCVERGRRALDPKNAAFRLAQRTAYRNGAYYEITAHLDAGGKTLATDSLSFGILPKRPHDPKSKPDPFELSGWHHRSAAITQTLTIGIALERLGVRHCYMIGTDPRDEVLDWCRQARGKYGIDFSTNGVIKCTNWGKKDAKRLFFTDEKAFRNCLAKTIARYKGAISRVGIMGELHAPTRLPAEATKQTQKKDKDLPQFWRDAPEEKAREQVEVMRILREEVHKIDPTMQVAPGGYFNTDMAMLLEHGMHKVADVWMVHQFAQAKEVDRRYRDLIACFKKAGVAVPPLWVDESLCLAKQAEHAAGEIVKAHAIYLFYGTAYASWHRFISRTGAPDAMIWRCRDRRWDLVPRMPLFTYAVMTKHLHAVEPVRKIDLAGGQAVAYEFRHKGETLVTAWRWDAGPTVDLALTVPAGVSAVDVYDIWDHKQTLRPLGGRVQVGLTGQPVYVRFKGRPTTLAAAKQSCVSVPPVSLSTIAPADVTVRVSNTLGRRLAGPVRLELPAGWQASPGAQPVQLEPGATADATFRVTAGKEYPTGRRYPATLRIASAAVVPVAFELVEPIALGLRMTKVADRAAVVVRIQNSGPATTGDLSLKTGLTSQPRPATIDQRGVRLAPGATTHVTVPLDCPVNRPDMLPVEATFTTADGRVTKSSETLSAFFCTRAARAHALTGALADDDWKGVPPYVLASDLYVKYHEPVHTARFFYRYWCNDQAWRGAEHWHMKLWQQWDEAHLYMRVKVRETNHINDFRGGSIWAGDALQIAVDADPFQPGRQRHGFIVALTSADGVVVLRYARPFSSDLPKGTANIRGAVKAQIKWYPDKHYTVYDLAFPKAQIAPAKLHAGSVIGTTVININRHYDNTVDPPVMRFGTGIYGPSDRPADVRVNLVQ